MNDTRFAKLRKKIAEILPPPVTLRVKKKISVKQKIGEGVVNWWLGGESGKCTYGPRLFFVS